MRNSSLADCFSADNSTGLKHFTEAANQCLALVLALVVEKRSLGMKVDRKDDWTERK